MATFDALIDDLASRFGLGANARAVIREALTMISTSPGGLSGFLDTLKSAGLTSEVASWLGHPDAGPMAAGQVERALGATALSGIAGRFGLAQGVVSTALGYALPKIVGLLTPGGVVPAGALPEVTGFLLATGDGTGRAAAGRPPSGEHERAEPIRRRALAMAGARRAGRRWPSFVFLVDAPPDAVRSARREGARAYDRRPGAAPASGADGRANTCAGASAADGRTNTCAGASAGGAGPRPCSFSGHAGDRSAGFASAGGADPCPRASGADGRDSSCSAGFASTGGISPRPDLAPDGRTDGCNPGACGGRNG